MSADTETTATPDALLKAAVTGAKPDPAKADPSKAETGTAEASTGAPVSAQAAKVESHGGSAQIESGTGMAGKTAAGAVRAALGRPSRSEIRLWSIAGMGVALGVCLGGAAAFSVKPADRGDGVRAAVATALETGRADAARLQAEVERLSGALAGLKDFGTGARDDASARAAALDQRLTRMEQGIGGRIVGLGERLDRSERDQGDRLAAITAQLEKRAQPVAALAATPKPDPAQTGSIGPAKPEPKVAETKPAEPKPVEAKIAEMRVPDAKRPQVVESWALREVYDGVAILEDRHRRLVEVGPGAVLPGVGRVDALERRGREWVVVTRQGLVTPQPW